MKFLVAVVVLCFAVNAKGGQVKVDLRSEGCDDPVTKINCGQAYLKVGGKNYNVHGRGMNFVVLDSRTGSFLSAKTFDWWDDAKACAKTEQWFNSLKYGVTILAGVADAVSYLGNSPQCQRVLKDMGIGPVKFQTRSSFVAIGYKQMPPAIRQESARGKGPTVLSTTIDLL